MDEIIPDIILTKFWYEGSIPLNFEEQEKNYPLYVLITNEENPKPSKEQIEAYYFLLKNQQIIFTKIIESIFLEYPSIREELLDFQDVLPPIPEINTIEEMKNNFTLSQIHIHTKNKEQIAFVGLEFECTWDEEHGVGFLVHKDILVECGSAEVAFR